MRGIAACLVVLTHISSVLGLPSLFDKVPFGGLLYKGSVGVDLFFVVSGFIITIVSLQRGTLHPRLSISEYAGKRFARIVPFLWICVIAYALVRFAGTGKYEPGPYLTAMFLWPLGEVRPNVVWTLRHEALFYLVFAASFLGRKRRPYLLLLWCLSPLLYAGLGGSKEDNPGWLHEIARFAFNPSNMTFGCGVLLGLAYQCLPHFPDRIRLDPRLAATGMLAGTILLFAIFNDFASADVNIVATAVVFLSLLIPASSGMLSRLGHILGDASYSIYLTHNLVFLVGGAAWVAILGQRFYHAALVLLPLAAIAVGIMVHYWIERPVVSMAQRLILRTAHVPAEDARSLVEPKS